MIDMLIFAMCRQSEKGHLNLPLYEFNEEIAVE